MPAFRRAGIGRRLTVPALRRADGLSFSTDSGSDEGRDDSCGDVWQCHLYWAPATDGVSRLDIVEVV